MPLCRLSNHTTLRVKAAFQMYHTDTVAHQLERVEEKIRQLDCALLGSAPDLERPARSAPGRPAAWRPTRYHPVSPSPSKTRSLTTRTCSVFPWHRTILDEAHGAGPATQGRPGSRGGPPPIGCLLVAEIHTDRRHLPPPRATHLTRTAHWALDAVRRPPASQDTILVRGLYVQ